MRAIYFYIDSDIYRHWANCSKMFYWFREWSEKTLTASGLKNQAILYFNHVRRHWEDSNFVFSQKKNSFIEENPMGKKSVRRGEKSARMKDVKVGLRCFSPMVSYSSPSSCSPITQEAIRFHPPSMGQACLTAMRLTQHLRLECPHLRLWASPTPTQRWRRPGKEPAFSAPGARDALTSEPEQHVTNQGILPLQKQSQRAWVLLCLYLVHAPLGEFPNISLLPECMWLLRTLIHFLLPWQPLRQWDGGRRPRSKVHLRGTLGRGSFWELGLLQAVRGSSVPEQHWVLCDKLRLCGSVWLQASPFPSHPSRKVPSTFPCSLWGDLSSWNRRNPDKWKNEWPEVLSDTKGDFFLSYIPPLIWRKQYVEIILFSGLL